MTGDSLEYTKERRKYEVETTLLDYCLTEKLWDQIKT